MENLKVRVDIHKERGGFIVEEIPNYYSTKGQIEMAIDIIANHEGNWMVNIMNYKVSFCGRNKIDFDSLYNEIHNFFVEYNKELHVEPSKEWKTILM